ncbi:uncharacterized protein LOC122028708 [Zingiber officinale]|uniref:Uncharacterized protein n=1 Tax=Zingiber officinale TaxID=94328 RepID=A0A8J5I6B7_ZINOF|nr:uncharacterized protein LOC122028708 [Zingiber officinale]XP_042443510.1 uncharacterized protein LOC122028708 [Zingiber officinale]KAG6536874.1 hypothetical protein ZIOFF_001950 [Zingiber officinale]
MASLTWFSVSSPRKVIPNNQAFKWRSSKLPRQVQKPILRRKCLTLCSSNLFPWEASPPYATTEDGDGIIKGSNIVEPIDADDKLGIPIFQGEEEAIIDMKSQPPTLQQPLKWPMWLLGPSVLLATGMAPTLWLPLSSVFLGPNIAGLLSLVGLDCLFNMGATLFLLMADACGRHPTSNLEQKIRVPAAYKFWKLVSSLLGLLVPLILLFASQRGSLEPQVSFISFAVLLGPYLLLLSVQMLTEMLTWHWRSPVWIVTPLVYEAYRVLQLMRGLKLAGEIGSPAWVTGSIRGLVSWWVLILGVQLMSVAWFVGVASRVRQNGSA